jgi:predicted DNA binding CopG/RHH family protein
MKSTKLDDYEKSIEKSLASYRNASPSRKARIEKILKTNKEKQSISLRINRHDLERLKLKSEEAGIPYQTFISSILHKYVTEQLLEQRDIIKSIQLISR